MRERAFRRARRHSRRVRALKVALPIAAALTAIAFVAATRFQQSTDLALGMSGVAVSDGKVVMANPKLEGVTRQNLPYVMTADRAIQDGLTGGPIRLEGIDARLPLNADTTAELDADSAIYDRDRNTVDFDSVLNVTTDDGLTARLTTAHVDIEKGDLSTDQAVAITLDGADIEANSMKILESGNVFVFENRVRVQIAPRERQAADNDTGEQDGG